MSSNGPMSPACGQHRGQLQTDQREHHRLQDRVAGLPTPPAPAAGWRSRPPARGGPGTARRPPPRARRRCAPARPAGTPRTARPGPARSPGRRRRCAAGPGAPGSRRPARSRYRRARRAGTCPVAASTVTAGAAGRGHEHPEQGQRRRVVDQALAAEDGHQPARQPEPAADGQRRHRVRRRDHRAQHQRRGQAQLGQQPPGRVADHQRGEHDQPDREQPDRPPVGPDPAVGRLQRRRVEQRRQHHQHHDLGVDLDDRRRRAGTTRRSRRPPGPAARTGPARRQTQVTASEPMIRASRVSS